MTTNEKIKAIINTSIDDFINIPEYIEECLYYTLLSVGLVNEGVKYKEFVGKDRKYRQPWRYYWKIDWNVSL